MRFYHRRIRRPLKVGEIQRLTQWMNAIVRFFHNTLVAPLFHSLGSDDLTVGIHQRPITAPIDSGANNTILGKRGLNCLFAAMPLSHCQ